MLTEVLQDGRITVPVPPEFRSWMYETVPQIINITIAIVRTMASVIRSMTPVFAI